jgi:hypothetical protein
MLGNSAERFGEAVGVSKENTAAAMELPLVAGKHRAQEIEGKRNV